MCEPHVQEGTNIRTAPWRIPKNNRFTVHESNLYYRQCKKRTRNVHLFDAGQLRRSTKVSNCDSTLLLSMRGLYTACHGCDISFLLRQVLWLFWVYKFKVKLITLATGHTDKTEQKGTEVWLWVPRGARLLSILVANAMERHRDIYQ